MWGKCQGSGANAYQVAVDLTGPTAKCSCPSRKYPCKHALALLLMWAHGAQLAGTPSGVVTDWQASLRDKPAPRADRVVDPQAAAARREQRLVRMVAGAQVLSDWLADVAQAGVASLSDRDSGWWAHSSARMTDAQLPGVGTRIADLAQVVGVGSDWVDVVVLELGMAHLATRVLGNWERLGASERADLRVFLGWPATSEELSAAQRVAGVWHVVGARRDLTGRVAAQRTWLVERGSGRLGLVLDFAGPGGTLAVPALVGSVLVGEVVVYPGSAPNRVRLGESLTTGDDPGGALRGAVAVGEALALATGWWAVNPWPWRQPVCLAGVRLAQVGGAAAVMDDAGDAVLLDPRADVHQLRAVTGGARCDLFGEVDRVGRLLPLAVGFDGGMVGL